MRPGLSHQEHLGVRDLLLPGARVQLGSENDNPFTHVLFLNKLLVWSRIVNKIISQRVLGLSYIFTNYLSYQLQ